MIILYIPFCEENDLLGLATQWKDTLNNKNIHILQYGNTINYAPIREQNLTVYVLGHGIDDQMKQFHLASSSSDTLKTTHLDIEKIAERFNSDFIYVHTKVKNIKLYFCNNIGSQKLIAERFKQNLVLFDAPIDYYAGTLFTPFQNKRKYSHYLGHWCPISKVRGTLHQRKPTEECDHHVSIKKQTQLIFLENAKQKRIDSFFQQGHKRRHELLMKRRTAHLNTLVSCAADTQENELNECRSGIGS